MPPFDLTRPREKAVATEMNPCGACPVRGLTVCAALDPEELRRPLTIRRRGMGHDR